MTGPLDTAYLLATYASATNRLLLFDYDGTLTPIIHNAAEAILPEVHLKCIETLASEPKNTVWVISGRDQVFLQAQLGSLAKLGLVAEHGAFIRHPDREEWENLAAKADIGWKALVKQAFEDFTSRFPGSFIEEKQVATVLHFREVECQASAEKESFECRKSLEKALDSRLVELMSGKCVLEARPANVNKGQIVRRIMEDSTLVHGCFPEFVFCVGDDVTDEDMFRSLRAGDFASPSVFTVVVGAHDKVSDADYNVSDPAWVWATIELLNGCDARSSPFIKLCSESHYL